MAIGGLVAGALGDVALDAGKGLISSIMRPRLDQLGRTALSAVGMGHLLPNGQPAQPAPGGEEPTTVARSRSGMPILSGALKEQYLSDPRRALAMILMQNAASGAPAQGGWGEAAARVLQAGLVKNQMGEINDEYAGRQDARNAAITAAMSNPAAQTDPQAYIQSLLANPETADLAADLRLKQLDRAQALEQKRAEMNLEAEKPLTPWQRAQLGSEQMQGPDGRLYPKYANGGTYSGSATPPAPTGGNMVQIGALNGAPAAATGTPLNLSPKARVAGEEALAKNLGERAVPDTANNAVPKLANTLSMIKQAQDLNAQAYGGSVAGPVTQMIGRLTNDQALTPEQQGKRDAYTKLESLADNIKAEMLKPTVGGNQISNADVQFVGSATSFNPNMTTAERMARLQQMQEVAQRKLDIETLEQKAALEGRVFGPDDVRAYYASKGLDFDTGRPAAAAPAASQGFRDGQTAVNRATGQRMIFRGGQWQPL